MAGNLSKINYGELRSLRSKCERGAKEFGGEFILPPLSYDIAWERMPWDYSGPKTWGGQYPRTKWKDGHVIDALGFDTARHDMIYKGFYIPIDCEMLIKFLPIDARDESYDDLPDFAKVDVGWYYERSAISARHYAVNYDVIAMQQMKAQAALYKSARKQH